MTPKEKALELIEKFTDIEDGEMYIGKAKKCALISINEILDALPHSANYTIKVGTGGMLISKYWKSVRRQLNNL